MRKMANLYGPEIVNRLNGANKYQQIVTLSFYPTTQAISFLLIAQVIYLNFHYVIGASLTVVALVSYLFQEVMAIAQSLYYEGHRRSPMVETLLKIQFYVNRLFSMIFIGFMVWNIVYMYQNSISHD